MSDEPFLTREDFMKLIDRQIKLELQSIEDRRNGKREEPILYIHPRDVDYWTAVLKDLES